VSSRARKHRNPFRRTAPMQLRCRRSDQDQLLVAGNPFFVVSGEARA
jgi:hypothetical protein